jgi:hypothetical protein
VLKHGQDCWICPHCIKAETTRISVWILKPVVSNQKINNMYDLELSRRLSIIKSSRATSRVNWLNGEKNTVSRTISVLVLRVLKSVVILETLVFSSLNQLTRLGAREDFIREITCLGMLMNINNMFINNIIAEFVSRHDCGLWGKLITFCTQYHVTESEIWNYYWITQ